MALLLKMVPAHSASSTPTGRLVRERRVDGVFVTDLFIDDDRPPLLRELGLPTVVVGPARPTPVCPVSESTTGPASKLPSST